MRSLARSSFVALPVVACLLAACASDAPPDDRTSASPTEGASSGGSVVFEGIIVGDGDHPGYTVEAPDGWSSLDGAFLIKEGPFTLGMGVWDVGRVPMHPCRWKGTEVAPGPTVDDLVETLTAQRLRDPSAPTDVMLAGHDGRYLEWSVPDDRVVTDDGQFQGCDDGGDGLEDFVSWWGTDGGERYQQEAGQIDRLWVLDVEGQTLVVDATHSADTPAADLEVLEQVVASLRFVEPED